ncbi:galectin-3 isoform X1 [Polypterus senegalus]|uniref:galectin-3 isoform X1 n=2 Tax=Polypterus senegalus TaxID=55291 RepID=UPI0019654045|nr:galectin-3 isoform X1 [Polypterus senegalus]
MLHDCYLQYGLYAAGKLTHAVSAVLQSGRGNKTAVPAGGGALPAQSTFPFDFFFKLTRALWFERFGIKPTSLISSPFIMDGFSLEDALPADSTGKASNVSNTKPTADASFGMPTSNPWSNTPGAPQHPHPSGPAFTGQPSAPGQFPGAPGGQGPYAPGGPAAHPGSLPYSNPNMPFLPPTGQPDAGPFGPSVPGGFPFASGPYASFPGTAFPSGPFGPPSGNWGMQPSPNLPCPPGPAVGPWGPLPTPSGPNPPSGGACGPAAPPVGPSGSLPVPFEFPLQAGVMPRLLITVMGEFKKNGERFQIDFTKGPDVVFHFNPRIRERAVVRNAYLNGRWGPEERQGGFPFEQGKKFEVKILCEADMFKVAVNGAHLLEYRHRFKNLKEITLLRVSGDLTLSSVIPTMV